MSHYHFRSICVVPTAKDFIDVTLSKTQRKTPTVCHRSFKLSRIRSFYMRKVRFTQQTYRDKLALIISEFPKVDDLHPFYTDLLNVLYDKDHFKLALGQLNTAKSLIDNLGKEYGRLLKFGDSQYRCKQLKIAALGRMTKIIKQQKSSLEYLEEVRQHLSRLPSIEPYERTILICGLPNVGKSSFLNKITRADVEVQPYAFTTKSLYVGHTDYKFLRWQVIDTPGILDRPLEERNTVEMQAITALAHINAVVLFFIDVSEQCGYSIQSQVALFESIRPLFTNKPLLVVANKVDVKSLDELDQADKILFENTFTLNDIDVLPMSALTETGISHVKTEACDMLLAHRIENKMKTHKIDNILNRLNVSVPPNFEDIAKLRPAYIPEAVLERKKKTEVNEKQSTKHKLERELEIELGDDYILDLKKHYDLENGEEKFDSIPELINGKNIADFLDPDLDEKFEMLLKEEGLRDEAGFYADSSSDDEDTQNLKQVAEKVRQRRKWKLLEHRQKKKLKNAILPRKARIKERAQDLLAYKRSIYKEGDNNELSLSKVPVRKRVYRTVACRSDADGIIRSSSTVPRDERGLGKNYKQAKMRIDKFHKKFRRVSNTTAKKGETDRRILNKKPKHLFSGKRKMGKTDRR